MNWLRIALIVLLGCAASENVAQVGNLFSGRAVPASIIAVDIVSTYGATCDGVANDAAAFEAFRVAQQAQPLQVKLTIPSGRTCCITSQASPNAIWTAGVPNVLVSAYGATLKATCNGASAGGFSVGGYGIIDGSGNQTHSLFASSNAGDSCITLTTVGETTNYPIGRWVVVTAIDMQGFGSPPNPGIFEFAQISSRNTGTGQICFTAPLTYGYLSTYPSYSADLGGPATIYLLFASWDTTVEIQGLTWDSDFQAGNSGRSIKLTDVTIPNSGLNCPIASVNQTFTYSNVTAPNCIFESDKIVETMNYVGGTYKQIIHQSSSIHTVNMTNATVSDTLNGTPETFVGSNLTIGTFAVGALCCGRTKSVVCTNCIIGAVGTGALSQINTAQFTIASGVISWANSNGPMPWCVPGANLYFGGQFLSEGVPFHVTGLTTSGGNTNCATNLAISAFPVLPLDSGKLYINVHPAPISTWTDSSGSAGALDLASQPALTPIFSSYSRAYTCHTIASAPTAIIRGTFVQGDYNVTVADSTQTTLVLNAQDIGTTTVGSTGNVDYTPKINAKTTGLRTVTTIGVSGSQTGDILSSPGASKWLASTDHPGISSGSDPTGDSPCLSMTVTVQADQGVFP